MRTGGAVATFYCAGNQERSTFFQTRRKELQRFRFVFLLLSFVASLESLKREALTFQCASTVKVFQCASTVKVFQCASTVSKP